MPFPSHTNMTLWQSHTQCSLTVCKEKQNFQRPYSSKFAIHTQYNCVISTSHDRHTLRTSVHTANNLSLSIADSPALHRWQKIFKLASVMLLAFPESHGRWLLLMVCAKMLQKALPHSHFSPIIADDIKILVTTPTNQSVHSLVSTVQVVLHPRDRRQLGRHFLTYPRQALIAGRKAQLAETTSVLFSYWGTFLWSLSPPALITLYN